MQNQCLRSTYIQDMLKYIYCNQKKNLTIVDELNRDTYYQQGLSLFSARLSNWQHMAYQLAMWHLDMCIKYTYDNICFTLQTWTQASQFMKFSNWYIQNNQSSIHFHSEFLIVYIFSTLNNFSYSDLNFTCKNKKKCYLFLTSLLCYYYAILLNSTDVSLQWFTVANSRYRR
jgi:hypothetical protein